MSKPLSHPIGEIKAQHLTSNRNKRKEQKEKNKINLNAPSSLVFSEQQQRVLTQA